MKLDFIEEPELEFGAGKHIDIRFGITNYGPVDIGDELAPAEIPVGLVGTKEDVERAVAWLDQCRSEIPARKSSHPNLAPPFPGFRADVGFRSTLALSDSLQRTIPAHEFEKLKAKGDAHALVRESVRLFMEELTYLSSHTGAKVLLCAVPSQLAELLDPDARPGGADAEAPPNFRDLLKAEALPLKPLQLMLSSTADPKRARKLKIRNQVRAVQDDATRAWNIHAALYYKAHGRPWRLPRSWTDLKTCFVGVSFYRSLDRESVLVSMAQVFDERGEGVVVRGGRVELSKDDPTPHLSETDSGALLEDALRKYRGEHRHPPARVVVHKTSSFNAPELAGFRAAADRERVDTVDFLSVSEDASQRLYRYGQYPPLRGTLLTLDQREHVLYTRGSVDFFETYPGLYVPRGFLFRCESVDETPRNLGREILALTKMNWNRSRFDGHAPITLEAARRVGDVLKYVPQGKWIADRYAHYM